MVVQAAERRVYTMDGGEVGRNSDVQVIASLACMVEQSGRLTGEEGCGGSLCMSGA